jgi:hypothetical protein
MSRILRRPMFRGGRVDSRGTGIASGLSYAKGGSVNTPKRGLVDGPGGYAGKDPFSKFIDPYFDRFNKWIGNEGTGQPMPQRNFEEDLLWLLGPSKFLKAGGGGLNLIRQMGKYPKFPSGYKSGKLDKYVDPKLLSNEWYMSKIRPYLSGAKETLSGVGSKIKDFGTTGAIGTAGGGWGLAKLYDAWKNSDWRKSEETPVTGVDLPPGGGETRLGSKEAVYDAPEEKEKSLEDIMKGLMGPKKSKKEQIEEYKEIFKDAYGSGVADDASAMALSFAKNALAPDATVKKAFAGFFDDESKRPSERKKYKDAATTAAINAYLTGEKDYDSLMKQMKIIDYQIGAKTDAANAAKKNSSFIEIKSSLPNSISKDRERVKAAAELFIEYTDKGKSLTVIDAKEETDEYLQDPANEGKYIMNNETKEVFQILNGIKQIIYGG